MIDHSDFGFVQFFSGFIKNSIAMDIMSDSDFFGEVEHMVSDDSFCDILGDVESFSDSHSESDWSDIGILDNIQETMIFDWSNEAYINK